MSMWTVRLHQSRRNGARNPKRRWVVDPPGYDYKRRAEHTGNWHRAGGKYFQWGGNVSKREAWREAMDYADHMARTVEVVLPRLAGCGGGVPGAPGLRFGVEYESKVQDGVVTVTLFCRELLHCEYVTATLYCMKLRQYAEEKGTHYHIVCPRRERG